MIKLEILKQPILEPKHPSMHNRELILCIAQLHRRRLDNIPALLQHVQLNQPVVLGIRILDAVELVLVQTVYVADVTQPGVQEAEVLGRHGGLDTAAAVVAADDDVLDFEVADRVVDDRHDVEVDVVDEVGNVAVDEHLAWVDAGEGFGGDTRVGAACTRFLVELHVTVGSRGLVVCRGFGIGLRLTHQSTGNPEPGLHSGL